MSSIFLSRYRDRLFSSLHLLPPLSFVGQHLSPAVVASYQQTNAKIDYDLSIIAEGIICLQRVVGELEERRGAALEERDQLLAHLGSSESLPQSLPREILVHVVAQGGNPWVIAQVCSAWRKTALKTPEVNSICRIVFFWVKHYGQIWSFLLIDTNAPFERMKGRYSMYHNSTQLKEGLKRAENSGLHVYILSCDKKMAVLLGLTKPQWRRLVYDGSISLHLEQRIFNSPKNMLASSLLKYLELHDVRNGVEALLRWLEQVTLAIVVLVRCDLRWLIGMLSKGACIHQLASAREEKSETGDTAKVWNRPRHGQAMQNLLRVSFSTLQEMDFSHLKTLTLDSVQYWWHLRALSECLNPHPSTGAS